MGRGRRSHAGAVGANSDSEATRSAAVAPQRAADRSRWLTRSWTSLRRRSAVGDLDSHNRQAPSSSLRWPWRRPKTRRSTPRCGDEPSAVDAINTFRVSAGHFAHFRALSRSFTSFSPVFQQVTANSAMGFDSRQLHRLATDQDDSPGPFRPHTARALWREIRECDRASGSRGRLPGSPTRRRRHRP